MSGVTLVTIDQHGCCPKCQTNWDAGSIFETLRGQEWCQHMSDADLQAYVDNAYGTDRPQRFSRLVGVYCQAEDRTVAWRCPDCQHEWPRTKRKDKR